MTTAMMIAPMFAPAVGGWVSDVSTWRWLYVALAVAGLVFALLAYLYLNETLEKTSSRPVGSRFIESSLQLLRIPKMRAYLAIQAGTAGVFYAFIGGAPYVLMELRGMSASEYGQWFMIVAVGYMLGNLIAGRYSHEKGVDKMIALGLIPSLCGVILFWLLSSWMHPLALFLPMTAVALGNGMCLPNLMSAGMSVRPELSGSASGLSGAVLIGFAIIMTVVLSATLEQTPWPLYWVFSFSGLTVVIGFWSLKKLERSSSY